jgi:hypothetical protein
VETVARSGLPDAGDVKGREVMLELDVFNATERPGWHIWREEEIIAHRDGMDSSRNPVIRNDHNALKSQCHSGSTKAQNLKIEEYQIPHKTSPL